jgi:hypothetical protein
MGMTPLSRNPAAEGAPASSPDELFREAKRLSRQAFAGRFPSWFLVPEFEPEEEGIEEEATESDAEPDWDMPTGVTHLPLARQRYEFGAQLFLVRKNQPLYPEMITIGRTANHDIPLRDPTVSKFHAHFRLRAGIYYLLDADSRFGTTVDGLKLPPRRPILVVSGARIGIGSLYFRFLNAEACHDAVNGQR